ncbi:deoxycytidine deaminase (plasmid) [Streptomyces globisporus]|uniref:dCTP deaminase n=1 Tax=Streptomyces globisporus TaxID=1908 RepID=UPI002F90FE9C|nr:deoxycytidine deaminase [Streptomyces globisporus]
MILTGSEILRQMACGGAVISPAAPGQENPVSFNYHLAPVLRVHTGDVIGTRAVNELEELTIPEEGIVLQPGRIYLGTTVERIGSAEHVPSLIGRSSLGRLGMFLQFNADLGNLGAQHQWTLEIKVVQPLRVYAGMAVGQVTFWTTRGARQDYRGRFGVIDEATVAPEALIPGPCTAGIPKKVPA